MTQTWRSSQCAHMVWFHSIFSLKNNFLLNESVHNCSEFIHFRHHVTVLTIVLSNNQSHNHHPYWSNCFTIFANLRKWLGKEKKRYESSPHRVCRFADGRGCMCPVGCLLASVEICQRGDFPETPRSRTHTQQRRYQQRRSTRDTKGEERCQSVENNETHINHQECTNAEGMYRYVY